MDSASVLVVDDEPAVRKVLATCLNKAGWDVTGIGSGEEAVELLRSHFVHVILCDLDLGAGINAPDLLAILREAHIETPMVILTGHGTIDRYKEALKRGAAEFLEKPSSPREINAVLSRIVDVDASLTRVQSDPSVELVRAEDRYVRRALTEIDRRFRDPLLTAALLAEAVGVSSDYLGRLFRKHLGRSTLEELDRRRVTEAMGLLADPEVTVYVAAFDSGFASTKAMNYWFKRFNGCTASEWRARGRHSRQSTDGFWSTNSGYWTVKSVAV